MFSAVASMNGALLKGLKALSDELSLAMLRVLVNGPATAIELSRRFQCKQWTARRHLEELCQAGLVQRQRQRRRGKMDHTLYNACAEKVKALFDAVMSYTGIAGQNSEAPDSSL